MPSEDFSISSVGDASSRRHLQRIKKQVQRKWGRSVSLRHADEGLEAQFSVKKNKKLLPHLDIEPRTAIRSVTLHPTAFWITSCRSMRRITHNTEWDHQNCPFKSLISFDTHTHFVRYECVYRTKWVCVSNEMNRWKEHFDGIELGWQRRQKPNSWNL